MRRLVCCPDCKRRFDASRLDVGSRFRCRCGVVLKVKRSRSHTSSVVRCSSCGGPRTPGDVACEHCGASFTLHERDLHTVCPECLTRVSDSAKFCHHCGSPLTTDGDAGEETNYCCPACLAEPHLHSRRLGRTRFSVLECDACAGLWLQTDTFKRLLQTSRRSKTPSLVPPSPRRTGTAFEPPPQRSGYRPCPICQSLMNRRNYGRQSGVIVDFCREHGVWFDCNELAQLFDWIRQGGAAQTLPAADDQEETRQATARADMTRHRTTRTPSDDNVFSMDWDDLLDSAGGGLGRLLSVLFS